jgi:gliding motility-associated-like protein
MKFRILFIISFLLFSNLRAQQFYVNTSVGTLYSVTLTGSTYTSQLMPSCFSNIYSLAMSGSTMYLINSSGSLYKADIKNGAAVNCTPLGTVMAGTSSCTINSQGVLYFANGTTLYKFDPKNPGTVILGNMPYSSAGDLVFYKNNLYMASGLGIVLVNQSNPAASTMYLPVPSATYGSIFGLVTAVINGKIKTFAFGSPGASTNLVELDLDNRQIKGIAAIFPYVVYDAASPAETGNINQIKVTGINITQDCDIFNGAKLQIVSKADTNQYTYVLNKTISNQTGSFSNLSPGNYSISIISASGDSKDTTAIVPDYTPATHPVKVTAINPGCSPLGSVQFTPTVANTIYTIKYNNNIYPLNHNFTNLADGGYHFTVYNQSGCVADTLYVNLKTQVCPHVVIDSILIKKECAYTRLGSIQIFAQPKTSNLTYTLNGNSTNTTGLFNNLSPATYTIKISSDVAAEKDTTVVVPDYYLSKPVTTYTYKAPVCDQPGNVQFNVVGDANTVYKISYLLNTYDINTKITGLYAGAHVFTVLNNAGCVLDTVTVNLTKVGTCDPVVFPNTFSPNNDGVNDVFRPTPNSGTKTYDLKIYNRLGTVIFTSTDFHIGWNGMYRGKELPTGTYYWIANYITDDGKIAKQSGWVALIR